MSPSHKPLTSTSMTRRTKPSPSGLRINQRGTKTEFSQALTPRDTCDEVSSASLSCGAVTGSSKADHSVELSPASLDEEVLTVCSDACTEKSCSDCCEVDHCEEICVKSCDGFVDCDDADACTEPDCADDACRQVASPCFNPTCVGELGDSDIAAALQSLSYDALQTPQNIASDNWLPNFWETPEYDSEFQLDQEPRIDPKKAGETTQQYFRYPSPTSFNASTHDSSNTNTVHSLPPTKRRKMDGPGNVPFSSHVSQESNDSQALLPKDSKGGYDFFHQRALDQYSSESAGTQSSHLEMDLDGNLVHCHWGDDCHQEFDDLRDRNSHVFQTHVNPQNEIHCRWNHCDAPTHPEAIPNHVKQNHTSGEDEPEDELICLWGDCCARFRDAKDLDAHLKSVHSQEMYCQWDHCGARARDPADLSNHLQANHYIDPQLMSITRDTSFASSPGMSFGGRQDLKVCRWSDHDSVAEGETEKICGKSFPNAELLHQHVRDAHVCNMTIKTRYQCKWHSCGRAGEPFPQKSKLDRHLQVHTGCML
ncbi:MAG: zinc-finger protein [Sclerophora amabilis]|nr:MAG: zinc-finger protein [Sclerophora amabilis]